MILKKNGCNVTEKSQGKKLMVSNCASNISNANQTSNMM